MFEIAQIFCHEICGPKDGVWLPVSPLPRTRFSFFGMMAKQASPGLPLEAISVPTCGFLGNSAGCTRGTQFWPGSWWERTGAEAVASPFKTSQKGAVHDVHDASIKNFTLHPVLPSSRPPVVDPTWLDLYPDDLGEVFSWLTVMTRSARSPSEVSPLPGAQPTAEQPS